MSAADYRHIAFGQGPRNCERVFRAAISAYCTLEYPTRREVIQLDDLALGLFDAVSADARRFAAAALSECDPAPPGLVRRLSEEPLGIAAPLLVRSQVLTDVDLIALIGRHGIAHARAIARRDRLNPIIAALIRALLARAEAVEQPVPAPEQQQDAPADTLEEVRSQLRDLMRADEPAEVPCRTPPGLADDDVYSALREAALAGDMDGFAGTLGGALGLSPERTQTLASDAGHSDLLVALKALDLTAEQALLLSTAVFPTKLMHTAAARLFLAHYARLSGEAARLRVDFWRHHARTEAAAAPHSLASTK